MQVPRWLLLDPSNVQLSFGAPARMNQLEVMTVSWKRALTLS
jgi:hypothetical protein